MDFFTSRRDFLRATFAFASAFTFGGMFSGCAYGVPSKLRGVAKGFSPYNHINPYVSAKQRQTFLDNIFEHKPAWAGAQYYRHLNEPIVAPANGRVLYLATKPGYHGLEDDIKIDHGGSFITRMFHCKAGSGREAGLDFYKEIKRGEVIGRAQGLPFKTCMWFDGVLGDLDDYGENMSYMKYWNGAPLDFTYEEIEYRKKHHLKLISELRKKYRGPGVELFNETFFGIPKSFSHDKKGHFLWSLSKFFKLLEKIYNNHPELFNGTRMSNKQIIQDIYDTQPVVLTLPFKS